MIEIVLTPEGDTLENRHVEDGDFSKFLNNDLQPIGRHKFCRGLLYMVEISETHHAVCCRKCGLRLPVETPEGIEPWTYRTLLEEFRQFNQDVLKI